MKRSFDGWITQLAHALAVEKPVVSVPIRVHGYLTTQT